MLDLYKCVNFHPARYIAIAALTMSCFGFAASSTEVCLNSVSVSKSNHEFEWVTRYFNSLDDDTSVDEVIDFIVNLRDALEAKGYKVPPFGDFFLKVEEDLMDRGIELDEDVMQELYQKFVERESSYIQVSPARDLAAGTKNSKFLQIKSSKKKKNDGIKMSEGTAKGFMKTFAGALLCIIPHPVTWSIGSGLIISGVNDMVKHAGDPIEGESVEERIKSLSPPPEKER